MDHEAYPKALKRQSMAMKSQRGKMKKYFQFLKKKKKKMVSASVVFEGQQPMKNTHLNAKTCLLV
jgi:hypothetical protein